MGFSVFETDLRTTADGQIVLQHDSSMLRTAGVDRCIEDISYDEFKDTRLRDGQTGLGFEELVSEFPDYNWIFDIKLESAETTIDRLSDWADAHNSQAWLASRSRFLFWTRDHQAYFKTKFPNAETLARESECRWAGLSVLLGMPSLAGIETQRTYALPPSFLGIKLFSRQIVDEYRTRGGRVLAFLPEVEDDVSSAVIAGFDEILTNGRPLR